MKPRWRAEIWLVLAAAAVSLIPGLAIGAPFLVMAVVLAIVLTWHLRQAYKLERWLRSGDTATHPPPTAGAWRGTYDAARAKLEELSERESQLRAQLDQYRKVARALPDAAVAFNREGKIELINDASEKLLGLRDPEDLGRPVRNLIRAPQFVDYLERGRFDTPLEIASPVDPDMTLSISVVPYGEGDQQLLLARDTSRLNRLERTRQDFIANVSHEMKSPLTVVKGYVENLMDDPAAVDKWHGPLSQIEQQTDRLCSIVEDLMALSNLEAGPAPKALQPVDVAALIRSAISEAKELGRNTHRFESDIDDGLLILGAYNELYSAVTNILFNAVSYTGEGGTISVVWRQQADGTPRFSVTDTGIGIAPQHISRLTERFYRVDQARSRALGGTGLGLAIVKHVLIRHKARLQVASEPGEGSTFVFVFPPDLARRRGGGESGSAAG